MSGLSGFAMQYSHLSLNLNAKVNLGQPCFVGSMSKYTSFLPHGNEEVEETLNFKRIATESYSDSIAERRDPHSHLKSHLS